MKVVFVKYAHIHKGIVKILSGETRVKMAAYFLFS